VNPSNEHTKAPFYYVATGKEKMLGEENKFHRSGKIKRRMITII
jgi:hypothetical protein